MKKRVVRNRLLELMQERERKMGRRMRQHDIAIFANVSDHTIIHWVRNETSRFDAETIERLCEYFNCQISDLLYFDYIEVDDDQSEAD